MGDKKKSPEELKKEAKTRILEKGLGKKMADTAIAKDKAERLKEKFTNVDSEVKREKIKDKFHKQSEKAKKAEYKEQEIRKALRREAGLGKSSKKKKKDDLKYIK